MKNIASIDLKGDACKEYKTPASFIKPERINRHTIFETVNAENQNNRQGTHKTKTKAEVSGTGKKPYKQKHTGRARQGSRRNPHFRGGGIVFGPTPNKNYKVRVNKKVSRISFASVWFKIIDSEKVSVLCGDTTNLTGKTKDFATLLKKNHLSDKKVLVVINEEEKQLANSIRNIGKIILKTSASYSVKDLLNQDYLLITEKAIEDTSKRFESWK